jgi:hypothetical protein
MSAHSESHVWYWPFILSPIESVRFDMIVYYRIIGHVIHSQKLVLLRLLFDVMLSCSFESVNKSNAKGEVSWFPQGF